MKNENIKKLKLYLLYISIFFCSLSFLHLGYSYIAENSGSKPVKGGTISEGIIGDFPSLNPLKPMKGNNKYVLNLLYRSLLTYDLEEGKIVGDITNCDLTKLVNIECAINENAKWSNGEPITSEDIAATYNLIKETNSNPAITSLLEGVTIDTGDQVIIFRNTREDVNFLNVFFQPILSQEIINKLSSANIKGNFPYSNGIYSGEYTIRDVKTDENIGVSKILFEKNEHYGDANISKITLFVFPDTKSLERNKQAITVFNDEFTTLGDSVSRLGSHKYSLSQFVSLFINTEKLEHKNLRAAILNAINRKNLISLLGEDNNSGVINPYFSDTNIDTEPANKNFEAVMNSLGYRKKAQLIEALKNKSTSSKSEETKESGNTTENEEKNNTNTEDTSTLPPREEITIDRYQKDSEFITDPGYVDIYNFVTKDDILLKGIGTKDIVEEVYINDYKLQGFTSGDENFYYRLGTDLETIQEGLNSYKIFFVANGEKLLKEEIHFIYHPNKEQLETATQELLDTLYEKEQEENKPEVEIITSEAEKQKIQVNTTELQKLDALDDKLYYSRDLKPYTLSLLFLDTRSDFSKTANFIKKSLEEIGISVDMKGVSAKDFANSLQSGTYDMVLGGIDTGYFSFNIFPYFHSSQVENGFNYGNMRKTSLDLLLEDLNSRKDMYNTEKQEEIKQKILEILSEEQFFKTLYRPKYNLLIDKNIKQTNSFDTFPDASLRSESIEKLYLKQSTDFSLSGKSIGGFIKYLGKKLYE